MLRRDGMRCVITLQLNDEALNRALLGDGTGNAQLRKAEGGTWAMTEFVGYEYSVHGLLIHVDE